jgi:hypothetical protein
MNRLRSRDNRVPDWGGSSNVEQPFLDLLKVGRACPACEAVFS